MNFLSVAARKIRTAAGTLLSIGTISDGHILTRSGTTVAGASASTIRTTIGAENLPAVRQRIVPASLICSVAGSAYLRN